MGDLQIYKGSGFVKIPREVTEFMTKVNRVIQRCNERVMRAYADSVQEVKEIVAAAERDSMHGLELPHEEQQSGNAEAGPSA